MAKLIQYVKFTPHHNDFQKKPNADIKKTLTVTKRLVKADKATNYYKLHTDSYKKLVHQSVTKSYKDATPVSLINITQTDKTIAAQYTPRPELKSQHKKSNS